MKWLLFICASLLIASIVLNVFVTNEKETIRIQKEIHYIQTTRIVQSKKTDSLVNDNKISYKKKKQSLNEMNESQIESTFVSEMDDTTEIEMMRTCLDYKYQHEQDSANFELMKADRDSCDDQLDLIVTKTDTLADINKNEVKKSYIKGIFHGSIITGGFLGIIKLGLLAL